MRTRQTLSFSASLYFPDDEGEEKPTTPRRLQRAKWQASSLFLRNERVSRAVFVRKARHRFGCMTRHVAFDTRASVSRIRSASLIPALEGYCGETDGVSIGIRETAMSYPLLVATLLHEGLHDWCTVRGRTLSCEFEHACMDAMQ